MNREAVGSVAAHAFRGIDALLERRFQDVLYYRVLPDGQGTGGDRATGGATVALVGPTAVGKTAVGVRLAETLRGEIVSADSVQVYRRLDIGAAKPTVDERSRARFHLVDVVDPDRDWTLADAQSAGAEARREIEGRGALPLIVGGTGLYIRALTTDLDIPTVPPDESVRRHWRDVALERGNAYVHAELARVDGPSAARIHVNDLKRVIRALEVHSAIGVPLSELHARNQAERRDDRSIVIGLNWADRRELYARIERRVDQMMADGLLEEVRGLLTDGYGSALRSMQSLGYRQMCAALVGECTLDEAVDKLKRETRHFARRQLIWFRGDKRVQWIFVDGMSVDDVAAEAAGIIGRPQP
ncbi:MAG: tRNA (adenosine(37)-N6)-dimethylallyltransferase MiaA [Capsulimonadaceae bacterium]